MKSIALMSICMAIAPLINAQNTTPQVSITGVLVNTDQNQVVWTYDLADDDPMAEVWMRISVDSGRTFLPDLGTFSGDVGKDITTGTGKQITWTYPNQIPGQNAGTSFQAFLFADDGFSIDIQEIVDQVDSNRLWADLQMLEGVRHPVGGLAKLNNTKDTVVNRFEGAGLWVHRQAFTVGNYAAENVIGDQPGLRTDRNVYILDAHFDTVNDTPGADDNGSGTVGFLEAARILSEYSFENSLRYIGFDQEEAGLLGSIQYVLNGIPPTDTIAGVLNMEMIGYYCEVPNCQTLPAGFEILFPAAADSVQAQQNKGNFITNVANTASAGLGQLFDNAAANYVPDLRVVSLVAPGNSEIAPDLRRSDHTPFWEGGWPALMLTDGSNFRNPHYHTPSDQLSTLDKAFLTRVVKAVVATAAVGAKPIHAGGAQSDFFQLPNITHLPAAPLLITQLSLIPNPVKDLLQCEWTNQRAAEIEVMITDIQGRPVISSGASDYPAGKHSLRFRTGHLEAGMYAVQFRITTSEKTELINRKLMISTPHRH